MAISGVGGGSGVTSFPSICPLFSTFSILTLYCLERKIILQCKNLHTAKCELRMEEAIIREFIIYLDSNLTAKQWRNGWIWGDFWSGRWCRACLCALPSPLPFVEQKVAFSTRGAVFFQITQYTVNLLSTCYTPDTILLVVVHLPFYWGVLI